MKKLTCLLLLLLLSLCTTCAFADNVIDDESFMDCVALTEMVIPEGTTHIGARAFSAASG